MYLQVLQSYSKKADDKDAFKRFKPQNDANKCLFLQKEIYLNNGNNTTTKHSHLFLSWLP